MTEEKLIRELRANGPLMVDFHAGHDFQVYRSGVLTEDAAISKKFLDSQQKAEIAASAQKDKVSGMAYADYRIQWQKITHATLLIGYGYDEELKMKYWLVRNSYG